MSESADLSQAAIQYWSHIAIWKCILKLQEGNGKNHDMFPNILLDN